MHKATQVNVQQRIDSNQETPDLQFRVLATTPHWQSSLRLNYWLTQLLVSIGYPDRQKLSEMGLFSAARE